MGNIPSEEDWGEYWKNFDQKSAYGSFFGRSNEQLQSQFHKDGIELVYEIRFMPKRVFDYYVLGLRDFIISGDFPDHEAADFSSYFLDMVIYLLEHDPQMISSRIKDLTPALKYVADNQKIYDAPVDIYGDFSEKFIKIKKLCKLNKLD